MPDVIKVPIKKDMRIAVASDAHYWPGRKSTAHQALCYAVSSWPMDVVVFNGDVLDAPTISKYPPIGWEKLPSLEKEIRVCTERMDEIYTAARSANKQCRFIWCLGNHDARFNKILALKAPQFKNLPGTKLSDFFPKWESCWRTEVGGQKGVVIKHEFKGGTNPTKSNTLASGRSMVTGHYHNQNVVAFTDYNGTRFGVDAGCIADINGPQFDYGESNPVNWRSGFVVLQFDDGALMPPQLATVLDEKRRVFWYNGNKYQL